jgi:hypothetical protein
MQTVQSSEICGYFTLTTVGYTNNRNNKAKISKNFKRRKQCHRYQHMALWNTITINLHGQDKIYWCKANVAVLCLTKYDAMKTYGGVKV